MLNADKLALIARQLDEIYSELFDMGEVSLANQALALSESVDSVLDINDLHPDNALPYFLVD